MIIFNEKFQEQPVDQNKEDNWLWINYTTNGSQITQIQLYDVKFSKEMR